MRTTIVLAHLIGLTLAIPLPAQVPQLINYQGRISVGGTNFDGTGQFKFALVNADATTVYWSNDESLLAGPTNQPRRVVSLPVTRGLYSVLLGDATQTNMSAVPPTVFANSDVRLRVWFNDGINGFQRLTPDQRIAAVGYAMMAGNVPDRSITSTHLASGAAAENLAADGLTTLPIGQNDGAGGPLFLISSPSPGAPNNPIGGYLDPSLFFNFGEVWQRRAGGEAPTLGSGYLAVWTGVEMIVWGRPTGQINDGGIYNPVANSWTAMSQLNAPLPEPRGNYTAIWADTVGEMIVWGGRGAGATALKAGGRYDPVANSWKPINMGADAPSARTGHTAVWTGTEMIVWGGQRLVDLPVVKLTNNGGIYDPDTDTWTAIGAANAPSKRTRHTAVWATTTSEMIVWGGEIDADKNCTDTGAAYDPATGQWTDILPTGDPGAPSPRSGHTAVWTGKVMIIWGGGNKGGLGLEEIGPGKSAGIYIPEGYKWDAPGPVMKDAPDPRRDHTAVWTGTKMVVWGGHNSSGPLATGGSFTPEDPGTGGDGKWSAVTLSGAPGKRTRHTVVWTGSEMIVWGGEDGSPLNDGGRYYPATDKWKKPVLASLGPSPRIGHSAVWTGSEMMVFGGHDGMKPLDDGWRYQPGVNTWSSLPNAGPTPAARRDHTAIWTGKEMIVWGGRGDNLLPGGARYSPQYNTSLLPQWTEIPASLPNTPPSRRGHSVVWTGSEMIVWGGIGLLGPLKTGGRYNPKMGFWYPTKIPSSGGPLPRSEHTAVWATTTGEMIVWGGTNATGTLKDGWRYQPANDSWTATAAAATEPSPRGGHTAVWTGKEMIVWGGYAFSPTGSRVPYGSGGRYDALNNTWTAIPGELPQEPDPRYSHTALWTGTEMIVWGGILANGSPTDTGGRFKPSSNSWTATTLLNASPGRAGHTAVWAKNSGAMLIFGGLRGREYEDTTYSYWPNKILTAVIVHLP